MSRPYKKHYVPYPLENAKCELGKDIVQCLHEHQWTLKDFSQLTGISTKTLRRHIRGQTKYKISRYYMSIYDEYVYYPKITKDTHQKAELARQIRDLPFKYELEEKDNER